MGTEGSTSNSSRTPGTKVAWIMPRRLAQNPGILACGFVHVTHLHLSFPFFRKGVKLSISCSDIVMLR